MTVGQWVLIIGGLTLAFVAGVVWGIGAASHDADERLHQGEGWDD